MAANKEYTAANITVLDGLDPVRKTPGMYIGSTSRKGLNHMVYEIVDNSVDEHLAGACTKIKVTLNPDGSATVEDNGRGIPVDMHEKGLPAERVILTTLHAGGKFDRESYKTSGGLHGVGSSVVNALSTWLEVEVSKDGKVSFDRYEKGKPVAELVNGLLPVKGKAKGTGTKVTFLPDPEIFEETVKFGASAISERLHETAYLNPSLTIEFENARDGEPKVVFSEPDGIAGLVKDLAGDRELLTDVARVAGARDGIEVEVAFAYVDDPSELVLGFCNSILTEEGGTHIAGFKNGYAAMINSYARELGVLKEKDPSFTGPDTRSGMIGVVSIKHPAPRFEGQTKTKLDNQDAQAALRSVVNAEGQKHFDRNLGDLKVIVERAERMAKQRKAAEKSQVDLKDKKFAFEGNGKLARQESSKPSECELFIVEGDSAGGSSKTARDRRFQAVLPIRGKILNVEKAPMDKVLANAEIRSLVVALGTGIGESFDIGKLKYDKVIVMSDADVDGDHISTLLLTLFFRLMPELIRSGHVYRAMPPLFKVEEGSGKSARDVYLYDEAEMESYKKTHRGQLKVQRYKGLGEMDAAQLWETTLNPATRKLKRIGIEDAVEASKVTSLLMGTSVEPRRAFIEAESAKRRAMALKVSARSADRKNKKSPSP